MAWHGSAHDRSQLACTSCHQMHTAHDAVRDETTQPEVCYTCHAQERADFQKASTHPVRFGLMTCSGCHNAHGSSSTAMLVKASVNQTCYTCHAEKRGPFLWEHAPVTESCSNCHDPHGTNHEGMLKVTKPRLCQQCHIETRHPTRPYGLDTASKKFVLGQSCTSCHVNIHGSNHPSGQTFTR